MVRKGLLVCGILAALLYVGSDILAALLWEGYSYTAQSVSELRGVGAPTRAFLVPILLLYTLLEIAFGFGVWGAASQKRGLRIAGGLLIGLGVLELSAPFFPMNIGEPVSSLTNTLHIIGTVVTVLFILLIIGFSSTADGKWFRIYSYATILVLIVAGAWAGLDGPRLAANLPTPWLGVRERINIYGYMLWLLVLALVLWRAQGTVAQDTLDGRPPEAQGNGRLSQHGQAPAHFRSSG
jgi:hypothetical protein